MQDKLTVRMNDVHMNPDFFVHYESKTSIDTLLSTLGGLPKGVNYMVIGDPGVGKTTVMLDLIANLQSNYPKLKTLFISAEMNKIDLYFYVKRFPKFGDIDILFVEKDIENIRNNFDILKDELRSGWDIVVIDSFAELQSIIQEEQSISTKSAESLLLSLIKTHNKALNNKDISTSFLTIQQVTKSGVFLGSNRLKHMITAMMELRMEDKDSAYSDRYITFSKHRRGDVNLNLYYSLSDGGDVLYDKLRLKHDLEMQHKRKSPIKLSSSNKSDDTIVSRKGLEAFLIKKKVVKEMDFPSKMPLHEVMEMVNFLVKMKKGIGFEPITITTNKRMYAFGRAHSHNIELQKKFFENKYSDDDTYDTFTSKLDIFIHEFGHVIYFQRIELCPKGKSLKKQVVKLYKRAKKNREIENVSKYSEKNSCEFFAECFVLYFKDPYLLPTGVKSLIEDYFYCYHNYKN